MPKMLVLSRKKDERIVIGGNIEVVVLAVEGKHVKLGLVAPPEVPIRRKELKAWTEWLVPDEVVYSRTGPTEKKAALK